MVHCVMPVWSVCMALLRLIIPMTRFSHCISVLITLLWQAYVPVSLVKELSVKEAVQSDPTMLMKRWKSITNKYVGYMASSLLDIMCIIVRRLLKMMNSWKCHWMTLSHYCF